jgi:hypothetical protein
LFMRDEGTPGASGDLWPQGYRRQHLDLVSPAKEESPSLGIILDDAGCRRELRGRSGGRHAVSRYAKLIEGGDEVPPGPTNANLHRLATRPAFEILDEGREFGPTASERLRPVVSHDREYLRQLEELTLDGATVHTDPSGAQCRLDGGGIDHDREYLRQLEELTLDGATVHTDPSGAQCRLDGGGIDPARRFGNNERTSHCRASASPITYDVARRTLRTVRGGWT